MKVPFYFDYTCPWAYLGSCRVERYFADLGVEIDFHPIYLKQMKEPMQGPAPTTQQTYGPRKKSYYSSLKDNWAECCGAEFGEQDALVQADTALLLKGALVAGDEGRIRDYHYPAYRARWVDGADVSDPAVVHRLLAGAGMDADRGLEQAQSAELDTRLSAATEAAIAQGVFGVPSIVMDGRVIWGNDHFELARYYIQKVKSAAAA